jgi:putrescine transport system permease protein
MKMRAYLIFTILSFGYAFLYGPIITLIIYSFNESPLVTVWSGFSLKWYKALMHNEDILSAAWLSLKIAITSATFAVILGTLAAIVLVRFQKFQGKTLFAALISAPLVMPEIIMGLALLMFFVGLEQWIGWPTLRGSHTITIAHITFSVAYVTVVIKSRLSGLDKSLEEAALDLGAKPYKVFMLITLPIIAPSLVTGWLLAFTLSLDDLVIASFVSGPGATTLPMVVFSSVRLGVNPQINALATIIVVFVTLGILIAGNLLFKNEMKKNSVK